MSAIKLDPSKLLGFKIIADGGSAVRLTSPKIGGKGDPGIAQVVAAGPLGAKVGIKSD
jgi:hypothetical protein